MKTNREYYRVVSDLSKAPVNDYLMNGYESRWDFHRALSRLVNRWHDRVGEAVDEKHGFLFLRFHDTPGGLPDEEWLPRYLLESVPAPDYMQQNSTDSSEEIKNELDKAFEFD